MGLLMAFPSAGAFIAASAAVPILIGGLAMRVLTEKNPKGVRDKQGDTDWYR
jgi:hypothetical protein